MAGTDVAEGPVLSLINKRLRALRKKLNRINQMEESIAQGKTLNNEQEDVLRSKPSVSAAIDELEKLRQPLADAVADELNLAAAAYEKEKNKAVEDLLNLLYLATVFDVKNQSDFASTTLTRTHERGCCLTYDYVTDDEVTDLLGERDLDLISMLGGLLISRPVDSSLSHKNALQSCVEHAKLWLANSDQPIDSHSNITYAGLRAKLHKIMALDYFTTSPEMKAPVEVAAAAAAGNYAPFQVPVEGSGVEYQHKEDDSASFQGNGTYENQSSPQEELHKGELEVENRTEISDQTEPVKSPTEMGQNPREFESKEQQYVPQRTYQNHRGGRGGRRGYSNGRGGRSGGRGGGSYQNGRSQYYEQPGNYSTRNYYNSRGRGGRGRGGGGGNSYDNNGSGVQAGHTPEYSRVY